MQDGKDVLWGRFFTGAPTRRALGIEEEAIIEAFRKHTLSPLDDCLYVLQGTSAPDALILASLPSAA